MKKQFTIQLNLKTALIAWIIICSLSIFVGVYILAPPLIFYLLLFLTAIISIMFAAVILYDICEKEKYK